MRRRRRRIRRRRGSIEDNKEGKEEEGKEAKEEKEWEKKEEVEGRRSGWTRRRQACQNAIVSAIGGRDPFGHQNYILFASRYPTSPSEGSFQYDCLKEGLQP